MFNSFVKINIKLKISEVCKDNYYPVLSQVEKEFLSYYIRLYTKKNSETNNLYWYRKES